MNFFNSFILDKIEEEFSNDSIIFSEFEKKMTYQGSTPNLKSSENEVVKQGKDVFSAANSSTEEATLKSQCEELKYIPCLNRVDYRNLYCNEGEIKNSDNTYELHCHKNSKKLSKKNKQRKLLPDGMRKKIKVKFH